ncbi:MAG: hypothetical protein JXB23_04205 [Candidatus Aminicenantes bacterium]|nr:hypothetical protein [Candidatus Aminicenantes bacterium]
MTKNLASIKLWLWIGIIFFVLWFLIFSLAPESFLSSLTVMEAQGYFVRLYGIFPLGWAVLFLFAVRDVEKNIAIINSAIITAAFTIISVVVFHFVKSGTGWFHWVSAVVLLIYNVILFMLKPKAA